MTEGDYIDPPNTPAERLSESLVALKSTLLREDDKPAKWRDDAAEHVDALRVFSQEFLDQQRKERAMLAHGVGLDKDYPSIHKHTKLPKRKSGYVDDMHQSEHHVYKHLDALVKHLAQANLPDDMQQYYHAMVKDIAEQMDDMGMCLTQGKTFAGKTTLPTPIKDTDELKASRKKNMFLKIETILPDSKSR